jgi:hypothetical protein
LFCGLLFCGLFPVLFGGLFSVAYDDSREANMVAIVVILVILWFLGIITKNTLGGFLHILLVIAVIFLLIGFIRGRGL